MLTISLAQDMYSTVARTRPDAIVMV